MSVSTWIEIAGLILGGGGAGAGVAKFTRLIVAVENLAGKIEAIAAGVQKTAEQVQDHEIRISKGGLLEVRGGIYATLMYRPHFLQ